MKQNKSIHLNEKKNNKNKPLYFMPEEVLLKTYYHHTIFLSTKANLTS